MLSNKPIAFIGGMICGLSFAPVFFLPGIFFTSILARQIKTSRTRPEAIKYGFLFGFGFYLSTLYWISFGVSVYINEFWWAVPFALFGLPAFMSLFTSLISLLSWQVRDSQSFHFLFCCIWVFIEWVISWLFTGLPWSLIGYSLSAWPVLTQIAAITGIFGLSFFVIYTGSSLYSLFPPATCPLERKSGFVVRLLVSLILLSLISIYGLVRLNNYQTEYTGISARLVQPSIPQTAKWEPKEFWRNLDLQIELSRKAGNPDLIIWSEAALTVPYHAQPVLNSILAVFSDKKQVLLTGGVSDNSETGEGMKLYSALIGINESAAKIFEYHKSHLVPFGEYMPLKHLLPLKKITHGIIDYTEGKREAIPLKELELIVWPLICYESIFPYEVRTSNRKTDVIINITNDSWYGNSSGPYQHFEISKIRTIENGLPMLRAANNGISAFIDPLGRVLNKTQLNEITAIDGFIPKKLPYETLFSRYGLCTLLVSIGLAFILQSVVREFFD